MRNIDNDVSYGKKHEKICMKYLNKHHIFGGNFTSTDIIDKFHNFDMNNGSIFVEHKKRPDLYFNKMTYDSLYFDKVKYTKYLELSKKILKPNFILFGRVKMVDFIGSFNHNLMIMMKPNFMNQFNIIKTVVKDTHKILP